MLNVNTTVGLYCFGTSSWNTGRSWMSHLLRSEMLQPNTFPRICHESKKNIYYKQKFRFSFFFFFQQFKSSRRCFPLNGFGSALLLTVYLLTGFPLDFLVDLIYCNPTKFAIVAIRYIIQIRTGKISLQIDMLIPIRRRTPNNTQTTPKHFLMYLMPHIAMYQVLTTKSLLLHKIRFKKHISSYQDCMKTFWSRDVAMEAERNLWREHRHKPF